MRKGQRKFVGEESSPQIKADAEHIEYAETPVIHKWWKIPTPSFIGFRLREFPFRCSTIKVYSCCLVVHTLPIRSCYRNCTLTFKCKMNTHNLAALCGHIWLQSHGQHWYCHSCCSIVSFKRWHGPQLSVTWRTKRCLAEVGAFRSVPLGLFWLPVSQRRLSACHE